jgi:CRISPR-associated exonuclease Cas4
VKVVGDGPRDRDDAVAGRAVAFDPVDVPISAIEHWSYCPRQCALIHVEQTYEENLYTLVGKLAHERVDASATRAERGVTVVRGMDVWSDSLRLRGRADVVEFGSTGVPFPIEYKSGRTASRHARLQLAAQALCLEEMFQVPVPVGAIYTVATRRRHLVTIDDELRRTTLAAVESVRVMLATDLLPPAVADARCPKCSLVHACLPAVLASPARVRALTAAVYRPLAPPTDGDDWFGQETDDPDTGDAGTFRDWVDDGSVEMPQWGTQIDEGEEGW